MQLAVARTTFKQSDGYTFHFIFCFFFKIFTQSQNVLIKHKRVVFSLRTAVVTTFAINSNNSTQHDIVRISFFLFLFFLFWRINGEKEKRKTKDKKKI